MEKHVLLVEDDPDIQDLLRDSLETDHAKVSQARTVAGARSVFAAHAGSIDLVILDGQLPDGNTIELAKQMKQNPKFKGAIIAFSANDKVLKGLMEAGCDHRCRKTDADRMFKLILELLE